MSIEIIMDVENSFTKEKAFSFAKKVLTEVIFQKILGNLLKEVYYY